MTIKILDDLLEEIAQEQDECKLSAKKLEFLDLVDDVNSIFHREEGDCLLLYYTDELNQVLNSRKITYKGI